MTYLVEFSKADNSFAAEETFYGTFLDAVDFAKNQIANSNAAKAKVYRVYSNTNIKFEKEIL